MAAPVFINGRAAIYKDCVGQTVALPDVCLCPPGSHEPIADLPIDTPAWSGIAGIGLPAVYDTWMYAFQVSEKQARLLCEYSTTGQRLAVEDGLAPTLFTEAER